MISPFGMKGDLPNPPNSTQRRVLDWVDKVRKSPSKDRDHIPVLFLRGGVGSGKSRGVMAPIMEVLLEIPGIAVLWVRQDYKDLKLSIVPKFFEILPSELVVGKNEQMGWHDIQQTTGTKGRIFWNGAKDIGGLGSQEFGVIAVTEAHQISYQSYMALKRRCRQENVVNFILMESEPPNEDHWLTQITNPNSDIYDKDIEMWELSTYENWDNLPSSYKGSLESMPEAWKKKYLYGHAGFIPDGKPYYSGYKEHIHGGEFEWNKDKELICSWDFGFHHPAVLVAQIDLQDRWIWLREIIGNDITLDKFIEEVKTVLNMNYPQAMTKHFCDPAVAQVTDKSEKTSLQILQAKGIYPQFRQSTYRERKEIIEQKLSLLIGGKPALMVDTRNCKIANDGFLGGYYYPVRKDGQKFGDQFEQPFKDGYYEHIMNCGEYIAVNLFSPVKLQDMSSQTRGLAFSYRQRPLFKH